MRRAVQTDRAAPGSPDLQGGNAVKRKLTPTQRDADRAAPKLLLNAFVTAPNVWDAQGAGVVGPFLAYSGVESFLQGIDLTDKGCYANEVFHYDEVWYVEVLRLDN